VVGEIVRLNTAAGSDGVLTRDEFNQVNVTNLSTAQYSLLTDANGGTPPDTDQELLPLVQNIDIDQLLELAAIIKLVVDGEVPLPAGSSDLLALISDPAAVDAFKETLAPNQLDLAIDAVVQDPNLTPGFLAGSLPASYAFAFASAPGTIRVGISSDVGSVMSFNANGTGQNICNEGCGDFTWTLDNGDLVGTMVAPHTFHYDISGVGNCRTPAMKWTPPWPVPAQAPAGRCRRRLSRSDLQRERGVLQPRSDSGLLAAAQWHGKLGLPPCWPSRKARVKSASSPTKPSGKWA
jgi:hypothetical protein